MKTLLALLVCVTTLTALPKSKSSALKPSKGGERVTILVKEKPVVYHLLDAGSPIEVKTKGKSRLRVRVRCEVPAGATKPVKYAFLVSVDGQAPTRHEAKAVPSKVARYAAAALGVPGDADSFDVEVAEGEHTVAVSMAPEATERLLVRFLKRKDDMAKLPVK